MLITATQIKITSILGYLRFFPVAGRTKKQLAEVDGLLFFRLKGLRTLSGWESREAMIAFRNNGHHLEAMKKTKQMGFVKSITWEAEIEPSWAEAKKRLLSVEFK
ncbi:MAG: hypothetical protein COB33_016035 [Thiotrichaceae bacterium]|nr:hypothetical protein [Thiotrichaceae bacterium]PCI13244.1 MAG: hypothetical protein COB71_06420 [Thiotrichales bacterium]